ncbi:tRNA lysidine(34) synthetase TilS [Crocinitomix catalasitica]|uniref:tRNA lysidine(34) synthetase TilS n=1 Tax=Crocinitomix catalasitica TaxID=184607 RepID=UPI000485BCA6|nr:tRNA lysidine(34) synthetase TilS [Crocinitomix catalasitica]
MAISGGKDSMALSHLLSSLAIRHTLLHCNFKLRGNDSELDAKFVLDYAKQNDIEIHIENFDTEAIALANSSTIQETARQLRYDWFATFLNTDDNNSLLTAHHLDDSIETFFINLMRGTSLKGLTGIQYKTKQIYRPLHQFSTKDIIKYINENEIQFRHDISNDSTKYLRNKLRLEILPSITETTNNFAEKMASTLESLNEVNSWMEEKAEAFRKTHFEENDITIISLAILKNEARIFLIEIFKPYGIHRSNIDTFILFLNAKTGAIFNSSVFEFNIDRGYLRIINKNNRSGQVSYTINSFPFTIETDNKKIAFTLNNKVQPFSNSNLQQIDFKKVTLPLIVRNWQEGDKIRPLGMRGQKLLSDVFIDKKLSKIQKEQQLIMVDATGLVVAIIGMIVSENVRIKNDAKEVLAIETILSN